jgi:peptide/nickel transport system substrate-binding protein
MNLLSPRCAPGTFKLKFVFVLVMVSLLFLTACGAWGKPTRVDDVLLSPTPVFVEKTIIETIILESPEPEELPLTKDLVVCLGEEPESLYRYGRLSRAELAVLQAIYENDYTHLSYAYQPHGVEKLPDFTNGDAWVNEVAVSEGSRIVNADGNVVVLVPGEIVQTASGKTAVFDGTPLTMRQIIAEFTLKPRRWADGEPVTAADSIYSYELASKTGTLAVRDKVLRTEKYEAVDDTTLRWTGLPGNRDHLYFTNIWSPLPRHAWGDHDPAGIPTSEMAARFPLGDGPFQIIAWETGQFIRLEANDYYYRANEGFPHFDSVTFRFVPDSDQLAAFLLNGECHIATQDALRPNQIDFLNEAASAGLLQVPFATGTVYEALNFGIDSWNGYGDGQGRPDWFEDTRVRQAIAMCIDRQKMMRDFLNGRSQVMHSFLPKAHPFYPEELSIWPHDVSEANRLLDAAGYRDANGDGYRQDPRTGDIFRFTITTTDLYQLNRQIVNRVSEELRQCGLVVDTEILPSENWYAGGESSKLFGRRYDLGHLALPIRQEPFCDLFTSWEITGPADAVHPGSRQPYAGWDGLNSTGWWTRGYDEACKTAVQSWPDSSEYTANHTQAQITFANNLPMIPLFPRLKFAAARPEIIGFQMDTTQESELWNLYSLDILIGE